MKRNYEYHGYQIEVSVEASSASARLGVGSRQPGFVTVVRVLRAGAPVSQFAPLRLSDADGQLFRNDVDALKGGYAAGRRLIDDVSAESDT